MHEQAASVNTPILSAIGEKLSSLSLFARNDTEAGTPSVNESSKAADAKGSVESSQARAVDIVYRNYRDENDIKVIVELIAPYLSEPYSVYCYRYFLHGW